MSDDAFDGHILVDKLSKLNSSQQSIESLSRWCVSHRKKARQIVESWDKLFKSAQREQRISFLYLANDILQNSRRKGSEFVNEFWKVLPLALRKVYGTGDENGKKAASRLVDIWEERKVFGSRGQSLKDEMLGKNPLPAQTLVSNGKNSNPVKIVKKDAQSLRIKLTVGAMPEKIITSFQLMHDQSIDEEAILNKIKGAIIRTGEIERDVEGISSQGSLQESPLLDAIQEQENVLQQCVDQLANVEAARAAFVSELQDALRDQEPLLESARTQLQVAKGRRDQIVNLKGRLTSRQMVIHNQQVEATEGAEVNMPLSQINNVPPTQTVISPTITKTIEDEKKAAAAAVAAKLAASASSAQMLTSVLSSLVAEEVASKSGGFSSGSSMFPPEKRPRLEKPISVSEAGGSAYFTSLPHQSIGNVPMALSTGMQSMTKPNQMQSSFPPPPPPPPPLPPGPPSNSPTNQFVQSGGLMHYGYGSNTLPPPPGPRPLASHLSMGLARPSPPQPPQSSQPQQQTSNGGYYRPPGIGFYGQNHQSTPPPVPRQ